MALQKSQPAQSPNQKFKHIEANTSKKDEMMRFDELSSMNGSPKLKPNPHLDLDALQKEALAFQQKKTLK
jgi:hypothetical protein